MRWRKWFFISPFGNKSGTWSGIAPKVCIPEFQIWINQHLVRNRFNIRNIRTRFLFLQEIIRLMAKKEYNFYWCLNYWVIPVNNMVVHMSNKNNFIFRNSPACRNQVLRIGLSGPGQSRLRAYARPESEGAHQCGVTDDVGEHYRGMPAFFHK